jgi:hypothetical protein
MGLQISCLPHALGPLARATPLPSTSSLSQSLREQLLTNLSIIKMQMLQVWARIRKDFTWRWIWRVQSSPQRTSSWRMSTCPKTFNLGIIAPSMFLSTRKRSRFSPWEVDRRSSRSSITVNMMTNKSMSWWIWSRAHCGSRWLIRTITALWGRGVRMM